MDGERARQIVGRKPQDVSVVSRGRDEQDDDVGFVVSSLQNHPTGDCLDVAKPSLGVDADAPAGSANLRVPCSAVARSTDRDLRPPSQLGGDAGPEASEQSDLGSVADRLAGRERADRDVKSQRGTNHRERLVRNAFVLGELDSADLRVRDSDELRHTTLREAGRQARFAKLVPD